MGSYPLGRLVQEWNNGILPIFFQRYLQSESDARDLASLAQDLINAVQAFQVCISPPTHIFA